MASKEVAYYQVPDKKTNFKQIIIMRKNNFLWIVERYLLLSCWLVCVSCSEKDDPNAPEEKTIEAGEDGSVVFDIPSGNTGGGTSGGTTSGSIVVPSGEDFDLTISQKSSYTDPSGEVFQCEPRASIKLEVKVDTVFVKDIASLTKVNANVNVSNKTEGNNPTKYSIDQNVSIGDQSIDFDISYESYTYVNSKEQNVLMPYVKLNQAQFANTTSTRSTEDNAQPSVVLADIQIKKLSPQTRAIEVTDTTFYEVTAKFNVSAEVENSSDNTSENIALDVVYVGVVTETNSYPGAELSYELTDDSGNVLDKTSFDVAYNSSFTLNLKQTSSYTDDKGTIKPETPLVAWTKITSPEMLKISKADELVALADKVTIETYSPTPENSLLPYYSLSKPTLDGEVVVSKVSASDDGSTEVYKAIAKYTQTATPVNVGGMAEIALSYTVEYQGTVTVELVDVVYEKSYVWEDAHDNIETNVQLIVTRKRIYSNGEVIEDVFKSVKHNVYYGTSNGTTPSVIEENDQYFALDTVIIYHKLGVPGTDLNALVITYNNGTGEEYVPSGESDAYTVAGDWSKYSLNGDGLNYYDENAKEQGWYHCRLSTALSLKVFYGIHQVINGDIASGYVDRFFCIDNQIFTFEPMTKEYKYSVEDAHSPIRGDVKVFNRTIDATYLGRKFHYAKIDSVYLLPPTTE